MTARNGRRLALSVAALFVLAQGAALGADPVRLTKPVQVTKDDLSPGRLYLAPALAVDPANPLHVAAGVTEMRTKSCTFMRSKDGGQTWQRPEASPAPPTFPFCLTNNRGAFQGQVAFGRDSNLYYAFPGWDTADAGTRGNSSVLVARSSDLGDSWETAIARNNRGKQGEQQEFQRPIGSIAVDAKTGDADSVYVGYTTRLPGFTAPNAAPNITTVIASTDGGKTWGDPVQLPATVFGDAAVRDRALTARTTTTVAANAPTTTTTIPAPGSRAAEPNQVVNFGGFQPVVTVGNNGTVYAIWPSTTANISPGPPAGVFVSKSTDKGKTWQTTQVVPFDYKNGTFVQMAWSPEGGSEGTLHAVWEFKERPEVAGYSDIFYIRSTDGGRTWSQPRNITDDRPEDMFGQYYPNITVAPNGRVDVAFYDTRFDPGIRSNDVTYTYSTDNGQTWAKNVRITDQSLDRRIGVWGINYDMTSPPSLASAEEYAIFGWDDPRNSDTSVGDNVALGGGLQDIYVANAQFTAIGGGASKAAKIAAAAVVGLLAVGLILLVVAMIARGRAGEGPPKPSKKAADKRPAEVR
jgi:Neuraminidase (sialidase)